MSRRLPILEGLEDDPLAAILARPNMEPLPVPQMNMPRFDVPEDPQEGMLRGRIAEMDNPAPPTTRQRLMKIFQGINPMNPAQFQQMQMQREQQQFGQQQAQRQNLVQQLQGILQQRSQAQATQERGWEREDTQNYRSAQLMQNENEAAAQNRFRETQLGQGQQRIDLDKTQAGAPKLDSIPAGHDYGYFDPTTKQWTKLGTTAAKVTPDQSAQTVTTADGIFVLNPNGTLGNKLGDRPPAQSATPEPPESVMGPDGKPVLVPRSQSYGRTPVASSQNKPPSEGERNALRFFERMRDASKDLDALESKISAKGTGGQVWMNWAPNILQPEENQLYTQAQRAFTEARLRKDSGAAIPEQEFANDRRMYFAQPGDTKAVLEQKKRSRETALTAIRRSSARAYEETYGESPNSDVAPTGVRKYNPATGRVE